jgi:hypothetical protein
MIDSDQLERARAQRVEDEIERHGVKLRRTGKELVGPCPRCGGEDRFSINLKKQVFNCRGCQTGGDVIDLVRFLHGCDFDVAVAILTGEDRPAIKAPPASSRRSIDDDDAERTKMALAIWAEGKPIFNTLAELYLYRRNMRPPLGMSGRVLRYHPECPFGDVRQPCLLSLFRNVVSDEPQGIMRRAILPGGGKGERKALGPIGRAAIKLTADWDVTYGLTIGEGLETTLSGMLEFGFAPAWALGSAQAVGKFSVLAGIDHLTILVDNDESGTGKIVAGECAERWRAAGRSVKLVTPKIRGQDMADLVPQRAVS